MLERPRLSLFCYPWRLLFSSFPRSSSALSRTRWDILRRREWRKTALEPRHNDPE